ncbi:MAG TPA: endolytic transglycosylase MltG [Thermodesulfobacteriota bacterium]
MRRAALLAVLLVLVVATGAAAYGYLALSSPAGPAGATRVVEVPPGRPFAAVARDLEAAGVVRDGRLLAWYARLTGAAGRLKAGEYEFPSDASARDVLGRLVRGEVRQHQVTIPEGWTVREIASLLAAERLTEAEAFVARAEDPAFARSLGVPADRLEGYLFPDTYRFVRGLSPDQILRTMVAQYRANVSAELLAEAKAQGFSEHELVTLASIVEKETGQPHERPLVAAVFRNRLKRRMPLQSDPTVIYGIQDFDGNIRKSDLLTWTPYNTYRIRGLPPGPIANPGRAALEATVRPAPVPYLYFVSRNDGTHIFATTLAEHERNVDRYQRRRAAERRSPSRRSRALR